MTVLVVASRVRAEEKWLLEALHRAGEGYEVVDARLAAFGSEDAPTRHAGALMREISHNRARAAALMLEHHGVRVVNSAQAITVCGDKLLTTLTLHRAGLPIPRYLVALTPDAALAALEDFGYPAVVKPLTGSAGRLVSRLGSQEAAEAVLEHRAALPDPQQRIIYAQEYVDKPGRDIRGLVAGDEVVGAVYRESSGWRTNVARDARTRPCPVTDDLEKLLLEAAAAIGPGFYGIDLLEDADGALYVNEVNHTPEFQGAAHALPVDIADRYVAYVLRTLAERRSETA